MRALTLGVVAVLASAVPAVAGAQSSSSKLAIGTIRGEASQVRRQILLQICGPYDCVAASKYVTDDRPDPKKLAAARVSGYLGGAVTTDHGQKRLVLTLTTPTTTAQKPARSWRLKLNAEGKLSAQALEKLGVELDEILQGESAKLPPAPAAPPPRAPPAAPPPAKAPPPPPPAAPPPAKAAPQAQQAPPAQPAKAAPAKQAAAPSGKLRFAGEAGLWVTSRKLSYSGATGGTLRTFDASGIFVPSLRLEVYPAAFGDAGRLVSGIGVYLDYGHSVGLKVKPPEGSTEGDHDGTLTTLDAGVLWRVKPMSGSDFTLIPALGYRSFQLTTAPKDGVTIDGLPDADLAGYDLRLDVEAPVGSVTILGGAGYTMWTTAKDLVSGDFFGTGSAHALEFEGGVSFRVVSSLKVKALVVYESTTYSDLGDPAPGIGTASGASDTYLGGRVMARWEY